MGNIISSFVHTKGAFIGLHTCVCTCTCIYQVVAKKIVHVCIPVEGFL